MASLVKSRIICLSTKGQIQLQWPNDKASFELEPQKPSEHNGLRIYIRIYVYTYSCHMWVARKNVENREEKSVGLARILKT